MHSPATSYRFLFSQLTALFVALNSSIYPLKASDQTSNPVILVEDRDEDHSDRESLERFLPDTKWLMYNWPDRVITFGKNGKFELADWKRQGISAVWSVTGPDQVTVKVVSQKFKNLTAVFNFDRERTSFTGHDLDKKREVTRSPRISRGREGERDVNL